MRIGAFSTPLLVFALLIPAESLAQGAKLLPGKTVTAIDARVAGDDKRTRFVIDLNGKAEMSAFTLADPYRVVLDFPDVVFKLPPAAGKSGRGLVQAFRYGVFAPGKARVVIDTKEPVSIDRSFVVDGYEAQPARLVLDLVPTSRDNFMKNAAAKQKVAQPVVTAALPSNDAVMPKSGPPIIVIDAGHGGIDSGAIAPNGVEEKAVVLAVAKRLAEKIERTQKFRVILTRYDDTFLPLQERVQMARMNAAALFISIHADSISRKEGDARGASIYTVSDRASDADAARLADKENRADAIAGVDLSGKSDDVAGILVDLAHRETKNFSGLFARTLAGRMQAATPMHPSPLRSAGFTVLRAPDVPSVLVELGFLSNSLDVKLLTSDVWRDRVTDAMVDAVQNFFQERQTAAR
jgi:N-acetylmuramoyl-L-alanine amidase